MRTHTHVCTLYVYRSGTGRCKAALCQLSATVCGEVMCSLSPGGAASPDACARASGREEQGHAGQRAEPGRASRAGQARGCPPGGGPEPLRVLGRGRGGWQALWAPSGSCEQDRVTWGRMLRPGEGVTRRGQAQCDGVLSEGAGAGAPRCQAAAAPIAGTQGGGQPRGFGSSGGYGFHCGLVGLKCPLDTQGGRQQGWCGEIQHRCAKPGPNPEGHPLCDPHRRKMSRPASDGHRKWVWGCQGDRGGTGSGCQGSGAASWGRTCSKMRRS